MSTFAQKSALALCIAVALAVQPILAAPLSGLDPGRMETPGPDGRRSPAVQMPGSLELSPTRVTPPVAEPQVPVQPRPMAPSSARFKVTKVLLDGANHYPQGTFAALLKRLEGREVNLNDVNAVADEITRRYREDGFLLVRTFVPAQKLNNGQLHLQVVEGKVNQVKVNGPSNKAVEGYAENIRQEAPLTGKTLERNLLLMNDLSGLDSRAVLSPSSVGPGTDLDVSNELRRWEGFFGFDNRDSRYFGPWQVYGGVGVNDPLGVGDHLSLRLGRSVEGDKMAFYEGQYELPLGSQGTVLSVLGQHNDGNADTFDFLNANSSGDTVAVRIAHPWIRSRAETFKTSAAFTWFNGKAEYLDDPDHAPSSDDRIRALRLGASWDFTDQHGGRNLLKAELSRGLEVLGASSESRANPSREGGETDFTKLQYDAQRIQDMSKILEGLNLYLALTGQTAFGNALLTPEQFGVGGSQFGRGYDPSEIAADNGVAAKVELQYNTAHQLKDYRVPTQYYGFWDVGKVWNNSPDYFGSQSLSSAGFGAHVQIAKDMFLSPELAFPLTRSVSAEELEDHNGKEPRLYFNFLKLF
ncbi:MULTISPECIES: ShlB/FhaC/HecB family hemolysin secretion/activation protein [Pseudomonas]|uniref:ShlB/FhaC/HecB family hemolysin secretion/activation protein n=1 Tax=Pseudomonas sp. Hg7Tf TaxID=3236988 RepID=A0AB39I8K7_9PSED|nr:MULTISPECIES: ShlB/FhaC/HecB family hemolysin secretion/activation protein [Pseudomonas]KJK08127.1 hemolysin activation/secretion protein [Pseudomonas sp. 5]MDD1976030.1 ShlB/FhaC/HecB family hemolysin secretion/activation protein [Pseudomonas putida]MDH2561945.1 ShlB/FhaC/HecB family hemolysin secretion/activation protein [Pseudomonas sp. Hg5Tf]